MRRESIAVERNVTALSDEPVIMSPTALTILASYNCTAACEHCCFDSHPGIETRLSLSQILNFIDEAAKFGSIQLVAFSGGECFILGKDLDSAIQHATSYGFSTRCVTNGYWAKSPGRANERIARVQAAGLKEINFSTGDFHQRYVPQSSIINGAVAAVEHGLRAVIVIELQKERRVTAAEISADPRIARILTSEPGGALTIVESPWMPMSKDGVVTQDDGRFVDRTNIHARSGCRSVLTTIVATPTGKLGMCCGLSRELIPELNVDLADGLSMPETYRKSATEFMKIWLFVDGPERILAWAASKDPSIDWQGRYAHHCHACLALFESEKVRNTIRNHYWERVQDVLIRYALLLRSGPVPSHELALPEQPNLPASA